MDKRGVSGVITAVLLVLLVVSSISVLWVGIVSVVSNLSDPLSDSLSFDDEDILEGVGDGSRVASAGEVEFDTSSVDLFAEGDDEVFVLGDIIVEFEGELQISDKTGFSRVTSYSRRVLGADVALVESTDAGLNVVLANGGATMAEFLTLGEDADYVVISVDEDSVDRVTRELQAIPGVKSVQPNYIYNVIAAFENEIPNDELYQFQWAQFPIFLNPAWELALGNSEIVIAIPDTGVEIDHPDLANNIWVNPLEIAGDGIDNDLNGYVDDVNGYDFVDGDNNPSDLHGHGTHVAGTVAAVANNGIGVAGVCRRCSIMPLRFLDRNGAGTTADAVKALRYAIDMEVDIISNSWGGSSSDPAIEALIIEARGAGIVVIAAAGNNGNEVPVYPAAYPEVIAVGATGYDNLLASFSNYGDYVDIYAPGVDIMSTTPTGSFTLDSSIESEYGILSGTSMAAPHVAGLVGLMIDFAPNITLDQIRSTLINTSRSNIIDAVEALYYIDRGFVGKPPKYKEIDPTEIIPPPVKVTNQVGGIIKSTVSMDELWARQEELEAQGLLSLYEGGFKTPQNPPTDFFPSSEEEIFTEGDLEVYAGSANENFTAPEIDRVIGGRVGGSSIPPDTHGAVGLSHTIIILNGGFSIHNKTTGSQIGGIVKLPNFFSDLGAWDVFDPKAVYDPMTDRFFVVAMANRRSSSASVVFGVSNTSDPTGIWNMYRIDADDGDKLWADYPYIGVNKNWLTLTHNMFANDSTFHGSNIYVINKSSILSGGDASYTLFFNGGRSAPAPAMTYDVDVEYQFMLSRRFNNFFGGSLEFSYIFGDVDSPTFAIGKSVTGDPWNANTPKANQLGTSNKIATNDDRLMDVVMRNGHLWTVHNAGLSSTFGPSGSSVVTAVKWWRVDPFATLNATTPALEEGLIYDVLYDAVGNVAGYTHYFFPSISVNKNNEVMIGFSGSDFTIHPSSFYVYKNDSYPIDTVSSVSLIKAGLSTYGKSPTQHKLIFNIHIISHCRSRSTPATIKK